jgi:uncharacterized protein DUF4118
MQSERQIEVDVSQRVAFRYTGHPPPMVRLYPIPAFARGRFVRRYVVPAMLVGIAVLLTMQVPDVELHSFFSIFLAAVAVAAYLGGWQAGAIASVISVIASDVFFLSPTWASAVHGSLAARTRTALRIDRHVCHHGRGRVHRVSDHRPNNQEEEITLDQKLCGAPVFRRPCFNWAPAGFRFAGRCG